MTINFIIGELSGGGAQRVMVILANEFAKKGHDISIITLNEIEGGDAYNLNKSIKRIRLHGGNIKNHKLRWLSNLIKHFMKTKNRPDVIISFLSLINMVAIISAKIYNIKIIASEHNNHLQATEPKFLTNFTWKYIYRKATQITVLTAFDVEFYEKYKANVMIMPNPCTFTPNRNALIVEKSNVILAVGNLNRYHHKGFDNLIPLIAPLLKGNPDWKLKILGGGDKGEAYLNELIVKEGLTNQIILAGFQSNVSEHMLDASIFILPSRFEGLPMVLLEAMSQGMACISYDCKTGPSDIIHNRINGVLVEDQNSKQMQKELKILIENQELRKTLSNNAINSLERFSLETISNKWKILLNNVHS
ncbi:glycosyltransferase family 4 protein [Aurantibacter sp.]|uniref:glycosyltransferase family 4 protein n=1 Tax=Aurantibacter sp. TaxID=2807103 RepID=UPI0032679C74